MKTELVCFHIEVVGAGKLAHTLVLFKDKWPSFLMSFFGKVHMQLVLTIFTFSAHCFVFSQETKLKNL